MKKKNIFHLAISLCILTLSLFCLYFLYPKNRQTDTDLPLTAYDNTTDFSKETKIMPKVPPAVTKDREETALETETAILNEQADNGVSPHPDRVTYADGFYYQPLTDDVIRRINGLSYKENCTIPYEDLRYLSVLHYDFDGNVQSGEIICNRLIAEDLVEIFHELYENAYEIEKIRLIDEYQADDDLSCADNNSSCFNFRTVSGSDTLSNHAKGMAIDINPFQNPYITYPDGIERISPAGSEIYADRSSGREHMITEDDLCYRLFAEHGFSWGGHWKSLKDYQHFEKKN